MRIVGFAGSGGGLSSGPGYDMWWWEEIGVVDGSHQFAVASDVFASDRLRGTASDATPLWIPQVSMALGTVILAIAFVDELVLEILGRRTVQSSEEPLRNE